MANQNQNMNWRNIPIPSKLDLSVDVKFNPFIEDADINFPDLMKAEIDSIENLLLNYLDTVPLNERLNSCYLNDERHFTVQNEPQRHKKRSSDFNKKMNAPFLQEIPDLKCLKKKKYLKNTSKLKYFKFIWMEPKFHIQKEACPPHDTIYQIQIYRSGCISMPKTGPLTSLIIDQIISIRGSQTLAELRDLILCYEDFTCPKDISGDPSALVRGQRNEYVSAVFFIENVFYVDNRTEEIDYELVQEVLKLNKLSMFLNTLSFKYFNSTTIDKIDLKFGQAYFFKHQASCEHKICFSDVRYCHDEESTLPVYPFTPVIIPKQSKSCYFCGLYIAKWMITKSKRIFTDPSFVCDDCFSSYFYIGRKKIENFQAFEYNDPVLSNFNYYKISSIGNHFKFASEDEEEV